MGQFAAAITFAGETLDFSEAVQHPGSRASGRSAMGYALLVQGKFAEAIPWLEQAVEISRESGIAMNFPVYAARLGMAYAWQGRSEESLGLLHDALARSNPESPFETDIMFYVGKGYLLLGRRQDAAAIARRALDLSRDRPARGSEARALWLLGELASSADAVDVHDAEEWYGKSLTLAGELGMRPLVAHCHLAIGKLYRRIDTHSLAREHLTTAVSMYREMDMTYWLEKAQAQ